MIKENGFTLIEIIASLLLVGFMAVFAGMGIVTFTKAYLFTKENAHIAQKAQLAMTRINRELTELLNITNASNTAITIDSPSGKRTIGLDDGKIKIAASGTLLADGDVLIDNVSGFTLSYWSGTQSWAQGINDIRLLSAIQVGLTISRSDTGLGNLSFATTIHPRNNNNYGGAPLASKPPTEVDYCFLATAAYGSLEHPAVQVLRRFRDKFLLTWKGGRTLVGIYYSTGPSLAHIIRDHQWAGGLIRLLLYPLVAFSFLVLNLPAAIPLILFLTWLMTRMFFILIKNLYSRRSRIGDEGSGSRIQDSGFMDQGSILVGLIIAMLIISALGAAMLPLTATSTFSWREANSGTRAYFLAESGLRYAASQYLNAGSETAKNTRLETMHNQTYTLLNNNGQFQIDIYPFYFVTNSNPGGSSTLVTRVPGGYPSDLVLSSGRLKIGSKFYTYTNAARAGQNITFTMTQTMPYVPADTGVFSVATSANWPQTVGKSGNLLLQSGTGDVFPARNGTFKVNGHLYSYKANDLDNNQLTGIEDPNYPDMTSFTVAVNSDIVLQKFVKIHSTGTYGAGEVATHRELIYHVPLPSGSEGEKESLIDTFEDISNWGGSTWGTHEVQTIGGDSALKVTGTSPVTGAPKASLIALKGSLTGVNLALAHRSAGYLLSYDAQVKIGFDDSTTPVQGFDPPPIPKYYAAGISFRLDNNNNSYGLSLMRGDNSIPAPYDNIDDNIVPLDDRHLIVLWQQTNSGATRKWLAYKDMQNRFSDDMESGPGKWPTVQDLWHQTTAKSKSSDHAWLFGTGPQMYTIGWNRGLLISDPIDLCGASSATLRFWTWRHAAGPIDTLSRFKGIAIRKDGVDTVLEILNDDNPLWQEKSYDLSAFLGATIEIIFEAQIDSLTTNNSESWYIDDVRIEGDFDFPINESTLLVRIKEAASIAFNTGGPNPIEDGDQIVGQTSGATGIVDGAPILASGTWVANDAAGVITIKNRSESLAFQIGETIYVTGSDTTVQVSEFRAKDNYIRGYYGDPSGCGIADGNLLDYQRENNIRGGDIHWPPDEVDDWASDNDFFTLIQWDVVDPSVISIPSTEEPDAIIRTNEITTPSSGTFDQPELGLHTFGHGSTNIYFDDFAVQTETISTGAVTPIQE